MASEILEVLYQCDNNYATLTGVSMISLMENNKKIKKININLLDDGISEENIAKIQKVVKSYKRNLNIIKTDEIRRRLVELNITPYKGTYTTYYKIIAIRDIQTEADRILYLDGDTIINKPLDELLQIDLGDTIMGAAYDCVLNEYKRMIDIDENDPYYNCGVMLINKRVWVDEDCDKQILDHFLNVRSQYFIVDQDVINVLFHKNITLIDPTYNFNSGFYIYGVDASFKIHNLKTDYYFTKEKMQSVLDAGPAINHCMGGFTGRPWEQNNIHPQNDLYDKYLAISPWSTQDKIVKELSDTLKKQRLLYRYAPMFVYWRIHRWSLKKFYAKNNEAVQTK